MVNYGNLKIKKIVMEKLNLEGQETPIQQIVNKINELIEVINNGKK